MLYNKTYFLNFYLNYQTSLCSTILSLFTLQDNENCFDLFNYEL